MPEEVPLASKALRSLRVGRAFRLLWKAAPAELLVSGLLWIANSALPLLSLYALKWLVDQVTAPTGPGLNLAGLWPIVGLLAGVVLLSGWCQALGNLVTESQSRKVEDHVTDELHAHSLELDLEYYDRARDQATLYRAQQEAPYRPPRIVSGLGRLMQNGLSLLALMGVLWSLHWGVLALLVVTAMPGLWLRLRYVRALPAWQRAQTTDERRASYHHSLIIDEGYAKEVRLFQLGPLFRERFRELRDRLRRERLRQLWRRSLGELASQTLACVGVFGGVVFVVQAVARGERSPGDLVLFYLALQRGFGYFQEMMGALSNLYEDHLFLATYDEFLALRPRVQDPIEPRPVPEPFRDGLAVENVSFRYPESPRLALDGVNLVIRPGQVVALVGDNGSGKTTLVKLLCRLYDPTSGRITLDGIPLPDFALARLRGTIAGMFQDFAHFSATLRENVWFGEIERSPHDPALEAAARLTGADTVAASQAEGWETLVGHRQEDGVELSGGQWQRLALARAFTRRAQLLILDEPTSQMDAVTETRFFDRLRQELGGRSVVLISHRLSTVRQADLIYVLAHGRVVEAGSHEELLRRGGTYAWSFRLQAQSYGASRVAPALTRDGVGSP